MHKKSLALAVVLAFGFSAAHAQEKVWKHGILEAKSDAGFIAMVDKGGFAAKHGLKVQLFQIKAGATLMKALTRPSVDTFHPFASASGTSQNARFCQVSAANTTATTAFQFIALVIG